MKKILIRDVTLRDGQQSLFATRMTMEQINRVLPYYRDSGFYAMEVWGGAVPDSVMRYLNEDPWERLENIRQALPESIKLTALSRGRNLFGYNPYPDNVIKGFSSNAVKSGIDIMRIFDALNDTDNITPTISFIKNAGGTADCAVCYTTDPDRSTGLSKLLKPRKVFTREYFIDKAMVLDQAGADIITIKDMAGLIDPETTAVLFRGLRKATGKLLNLHTHCTTGYGIASALTAIMNGADIIDTAVFNFSAGTAAPPYEIIRIFADMMGLDTGVNDDAVFRINSELKQARQELAQFDTTGIFPIDYRKGTLQDEVKAHFDRAIENAIKGNYSALLQNTDRISEYFNLPPGDEIIKTAQIPGGMYSNMIAQLKQFNMENRMDEILALVPRVRKKAGYVPLVTPTSQIVGSQAVNLLLDLANGKKAYTTKSTQFINLIKGLYGKTPVAISEDFRYEIAGHREEMKYTDDMYKEPQNTNLSEYGNMQLAKTEKEKLLLELFPQTAEKFLEARRKAEFEHMMEHDSQFRASMYDQWEELATNM